MFWEFVGSKQTPLLVFLNIIVVFLLYRTLRPVLANNYYVRETKYKYIWLVILVFCIFSFWGTDWYGYLLYYERVKSGWSENVPMEDFYIWLMDVLPSYLLFRIIVWGAAIVLLRRTLINVNIRQDLFLFFFSSISLIWFAYARASLAMAIMYCGASYLYASNLNIGKRTIYTIIGVSLIVASFFFHKSAIIGIGALALAIVLHKLSSRNGIILLLCLFPFAILLVQSVFSDLFASVVEDEGNILNEYANAGSSYLESAMYQQGWGIKVQHLLEWLPSYYLSYVCLKAMYSESQYITKDMKLMMYTLCAMVFVASIFYFDIGYNTRTVFVRMMRYTQIPLCICLAYLYQNDLYVKDLKKIIKIAILGSFYALIYMMYNTFFY